MASSVARDMSELKEIVSEIKNLNQRSKELRDRKKELENKILDYLEQTEQPGVKFKELIVLKSETTSHFRKNKKEKQEDIIKVLEENGISEPQKVYGQITKAMIGDEHTKTRLKVKQTLPDLL